MKRFDVVVIGATRAGLAIGDALSAAGRSVALVKTPGDGEADRLLSALGGLPADEHAIRFEELAGPARFLSPTRLAINGDEVTAARFVIAVGAVPAGEWDLAAVTPLIDAFEKPAPASAVVLGAGPLAVAAADRLAREGARVALITREARLLASEDESLADEVTGRLKARGVQVHTGAAALTWSPSGTARWTVGGKSLDAQGDSFFAETALRADTAGLNLGDAGVHVDGTGRVVANEEMRTSRPNIWAAGHAVSPGASAAEHIAQAALAAHNATAGIFSRRKAEPAVPPTVLHTVPPAARVGLTEAEARARHTDVVVAAAQGSGVIKLVGRRRNGQLLGAHVLGDAAPQTILFFDLMLRAELPISDVADRRHFPLIGEADAVYRALLAWNAAASA